MLDFTQLNLPTAGLANRHCAACAPLKSFVHEHREALLDTATLLGGRQGANLAYSVLDGLADGRASTGSLSRKLDDLIDLLALENVHREERPEAACFAALDPWDPVVEEICLLTDGFRDAVEEWEALHDLAEVEEETARIAA